VVNPIITRSLLTALIIIYRLLTRFTAHPAEWYCLHKFPSLLFPFATLFYKILYTLSEP
jgi:hypothetical protein